jgi:hypothetical protein
MILFCLSIFGIEAEQLYQQKQKPETKITLELAQLYDEYKSYKARKDFSSSATQIFSPTSELITVIDERVAIEAVANDNVDLLRTDLQALGLKHASVYGRMVSGLLPVSAIDNLRRLESLRFARPVMATTSPQGGSN